MGFFDSPEGVASAGQAAIGGLKFLRGRRDRREAEAAELSYLDQSEWGQLRPDEKYMGQVLKDLDKSNIPKDLGERIATESIRYTGSRQAATARGDQEKYEQTGFDPAVYQELLEWAKKNNPGMFQNLIGGEGQDVLRGYVPGEGAVGPDPSSTDPEMLQELVEEGGIPILPEDPDAADIARLTTQFDYPRAEEAFQEEKEQVGKYGEDVEALLGREGALHADITGAEERGQAAVSGIQTGVDAAVTEGRAGIQDQIAALKGDIAGGVESFEARRSRALSEFTDDTASRIEQQRFGMQRAFKQDTERMMQEMQAQGMSQREITAAVRTRSWSERENIGQIAQKHNIEVARARSDLGTTYDTMTAEFEKTGLGEVGAMRRIGAEAEVGFTRLKSLAVESTARYQIDLDRSIVGFRQAADSAYLTGQQNYGQMLAHLSNTMPEAAVYAMGAYKILEYEQLADRALEQDNLAALSAGLQSIFNYGASKDTGPGGPSTGANIATGALGGAGAGAMAGAPAGPIGMAIGAGIGAALGGTAGAL